MDYEGRLTVQRGFGLTDYLLELKVGKCCYIPIDTYNIPTVRATISRLKKTRGLLYETKKIKKKNEPLREIRVTRLK